jgi:hypothetical protein
MQRPQTLTHNTYSEIHSYMGIRLKHSGYYM